MLFDRWILGKVPTIGICHIDIVIKIWMVEIEDGEMNYQFWIIPRIILI